MPAELDQLLAFGNELLTGCREQLATLPITRFGPAQASGRTAAAMRVEGSETPDGYRLQLIAPSSILTLIFGRKPGRFPPLKDIEQWIADRNIVPRPDKNGKSISTKSLAFLIGRSIRDKGNTVHQQGGSKLFADILNQDNISAGIKARVVPLLVQQVLSEIRQAVAA